MSSFDDQIHSDEDPRAGEEYSRFLEMAYGDGDEQWEDDDEYEDDGQPSEYEEWQDVYGGDDWDHGQYDDGGW